MENKALLSVFGILYDYSMKKQLLDEAAVYEMVRIYLVENGLSGLVRNVVFTDLSASKTYGYYDSNTRIIFFDLNFIKETVNKRHYTDRYYVNCVNLINQELIHSIFHEINHAFRFGLPHNRFDIFDWIGKNVYNLSKNDLDLYKMLHDYFPTEKEANVFGYECCIWLFQYLNGYIQDDYGLNNLYIGFLRTLLDGYNINSFLDNPLKKVVLSSNCDKEELRYIKYLVMKKAIEVKNMDLYQKLTFGFPIKADEYEFVNGILQNVLLYQQDANLDIKRLILSKD